MCAVKRISIKLRIESRCSLYGEKRNAYIIFVVQPQRKRPFGRPTPKWEDNIKIDRKEIGREIVAQDMVLWRVFVNNKKPSCSIEAGNF
jgi:hypothetical protein